MGKLGQKWGALKPWQRYAVVGLLGLIIGAIAGAFGNPPVPS